MRTIKVGREFTGYVMLKHKACGAATRVDVRQRPANADSESPHWYIYGYTDTTRPMNQRICHFTHACNGCGKQLNMFYATPIYGSFHTEHICDGRCMGATGPTCDCSCGGLNHGGKHQAA